MTSVLTKYLGWLPPFIDKRKKYLLNDNIDLKQWEINVCYLLAGVRRLSIDPTPQEKYLLDNVTPLVAKINDNLVPPIAYPLALSKHRHFWYIAAYPDVIDYFYPSRDYLSKNKKKEEKRVREAKRKVNKDFERFMRAIEKNYGENINHTQFLLLLKDYYKNTLKKKLLLSKDR